MIILHEDMSIAAKEAQDIAQQLESVYGFDSQLVSANLRDFLPWISDTEILSTSLKLRDRLKADYPKREVLVLTPIDILEGRNTKTIDRNEDWLFGYSIGNLSMISTARLQGNLWRLKLLTVGEIGWGVIDPKHQRAHYQEASYVDAKTDSVTELGPHCTNNHCAMYPVVDICSPRRNIGFLQLGNKKRYDAGLDDLLERIIDNDDWLCPDCRSAVKVSNAYR
ncbi:MAG: hypothetical protein WC796_06230 [Candidatus Pacearchaeota archaeon]|jgi:hypothetical protein